MTREFDVVVQDPRKSNFFYEYTAPALVAVDCISTLHHPAMHHPAGFPIRGHEDHPRFKDYQWDEPHQAIRIAPAQLTGAWRRGLTVNGRRSLIALAAGAVVATAYIGYRRVQAAKKAAALALKKPHQPYFLVLTRQGKVDVELTAQASNLLAKQS
jgi:hypothetical protein